MCKETILTEAEYILETNVTIREAARYFEISKSALHRHMNNLKYIDYNKYLKIKKLFLEHTKIRHILGGEATKKKFNAGD